jgi:C-terminal processing protease CtpA/Prc
VAAVLLSSAKGQTCTCESNFAWVKKTVEENNEKTAIDKLLADNQETILKTENLIIDLRNNGSGSSASFTNLLPLLYTNSVRIVSAEYLSTTQNIQQLLVLLSMYD